MPTCGRPGTACKSGCHCRAGSSTRDSGRIMIDAKGEDSGGYGSRQMTLLMVEQADFIAQDRSRGCVPDRDPHDRGYMKALRTFRGSLAFERLGRVLFLGGRDGDAREL